MKLDSHPAYLLESQDDVNRLFRIDNCIGLMQCTSSQAIECELLLEFSGRDGSQEGESIRLNEVFRLSKVVQSEAIEIGYLVCRRLLTKRCKLESYLALLLEIDIQKIQLLESFLGSVDMSFRELNVSYSGSWLSACCELLFTYNKPSFLCTNIKLTSEDLKSIESFYCYLGESFFGYTGYAGRDLDGCFEILRMQEARREIRITICDEKRMRDFLEIATNQRDYYDRFIAMIEDVGGQVFR